MAVEIFRHSPLATRLIFSRRSTMGRSSKQKRKQSPNEWVRSCPDGFSCPSPQGFNLWISRVDLEDSILPPKSIDRCVEVSPVSCEDTKPKACPEDEASALPGKIVVHRLPSDRKPMPRKHFKRFQERPDGDCGDGIPNPDPTRIPNQFWAQRYRYFERYNQGIQIDVEGWYSVTPRVVARDTAQKLTGRVILDAFCGVGGNSIAFAEHADLVICVDTSLERLRMAAHNCEVYKIPKEKLVFVLADAMDVLKAYRNGKLIERALAAGEPKEICSDNDGGKQKCSIGGLELLPDSLDAIYLSPPWGGTDNVAQASKGFDLTHIVLNNGSTGEDILSQSIQALPSKRPRIAYFLPKNLNGESMALCAAACGLTGCTLEQNNINCKLKAVTVYSWKLPE